MAKSKAKVQKEDLKLNILGTDYEIVVAETHDRYYGLMDSSIKRISLCKMTEGDLSKKNLKEFVNETLRHEVIHAMFHESGMSSWNNDENLVEWIALQLPKLAKLNQDIEKIDIGNLVIM